MSMDVVAYLESKGLHGKATGSGQIAYPCFFDCGEPPTSKKRKLYISVREKTVTQRDGTSVTDNAWFDCKVCGAKGGSYLLRKHFGDVDLLNGHSDPHGIFGSLRRREILEEAAARAHAMLLNNDELLMYLLDERGLSEHTIIERRLGWVGNRWSLVDGIAATKDELLKTGLVVTSGDRQGRDFFYSHLIIPYMSLGSVVQIRGKCLSGSAQGRYMTGPGEQVRLYNADDAHLADEVIITEGEFDAMILSQTLTAAPDERARRVAVVGMPGLDAVPRELEERLADARRVFIGFDSDDPGRRGAVKIQKHLGSRARILQLPNPEPGHSKVDWTDYLSPKSESNPVGGHGWADVLQLMADVGGRRLFSFGEALAKLQDQRALVGGVTTGFSGFDATIKAIYPGQVFVPMAKTGVGKTLWLCNVVMHNLNRPVLFSSLEMTQEEVAERLLRIYRFHHPRATDAEVKRAFSRLMINDSNRLSAEELSELVEEYHYERGERPELFLMDYLGYFARSAPGKSRYEQVSEAIMQIKGFAKDERLPVITPHQVSRQGKEGRPLSLEDARDSGVVEETADHMVSLYRPGDALEGQAMHEREPDGRIRMEILKSRHGGKGKAYSLQMDLLTLAIVDVDAPCAARAHKHTRDAWRGMTYEELRAHETQPEQTRLMGASR